MNLRCVVAAVLLALAPLARSQSPASDAVIRINVNLIQVDAIVVDSTDKPVTDLTASDFEILQDGKAQRITNFSYITTNGRTNFAPPPSAVRRQLPAPPPAVLKPSDVHRTIALVVDDLGIAFESMSRIRRSLTRFVDEKMQPGDLVAIVRTSAGMGALQQFTADKRILHAAIGHVRFNGAGRVGVSSFEPLGEDPPMRKAEANIALNNFKSWSKSIYSMGSLGAIRYIIEGMSGIPGRKSLILFSENLQLYNSQVAEMARRLADAANRASVVIYGLDPRGVSVHALTAQDNTQYSSQATLRNVPMQRAAEELRGNDVMVMLAAATGGLFVHNNNDLEASVDKVVEDGGGYYLIGYHPDNATFDGLTSQSKFRKLVVHVKKPGLHVRSRSGFFGVPDREPQPGPPGWQAEIARALRSPFSGSGIHVRLTPLFSHSPEKGAYLNTMLYIDARDLKFTDEPDGWHHAAVDLVAVTVGEDGQPVDTRSRMYNIRARSPIYEGALQDGLLYSVSFPVSKPGAYQMRVVVRDQASALLGSANQFIEVPDVKHGRLTMTSIILREQPGQSAAMPESQAEGQVAEANPLGNPAVRIFKRGSSVHYAYRILNAHADANGRPSLESQTTLFRDGQEIYAGKATVLEANGQPDPKRLDTGGNLRLSERMPPGDYVMQIVVTDKLAPERFQTSSQWMDFQVQ